MAEEIQVTGLKELDAALKNLSLKIAKTHLRAAMREGANVFLDGMLSLVSRSHGRAEREDRIHIADDLRVRVSASKGGKVTARIGPTKKTAYKANFLEFGTAPHLIEAKEAKALFVPGQGFVKSVRHPGAPAKPFMRPTFDTRYNDAIATVRDMLAEFIG